MPLIGSSIRARLVLLVLVATLPPLLFSGSLIQRSFRVSAGLIEDTATGYARRLAVTVDGQVSRAQAVVLALTELPTVDRPDLTEFEDAATRALAASGLEASLQLVERDGSIAAQTLRLPGQRLPGQRLPTAAEPALVERVFATGQPQLSTLGIGRLTGEPQISIHLPVTRNGRVRYDAVVALAAHAIAGSLAPQTLPEGWSAVVADPSGRIIARSFRPDPDVGEPIPASMAALASGHAEGFGTAISREGTPIFAGFTHAARTGWLVAVAVPQAVVRGPRLRSLALLIGGGLLLLLASLAAAWRVGRAIARPVDALAHEAARLGRNELPDPAAAQGLAEAEAVARALHRAGQMLITRDQERAAALRRAEESEARLLLAQDVGEIGAWETESANGERTWSQQQFRLYGVDPADGPPHGDAWAAMIHPEDRDRVLATVARAYAAPISYQHEFRIVQPRGAVRWLRTAGRSQFRDGRAERLIGISFDTTDRHDAERALRDSAARLEEEVAARTRELAESEVRFRTYFEHSGEAMVVVRVEPDGRFVFESINRACERLTGLRGREIIGRTPEEVLSPETAADVLRHYREAASERVTLRRERTLSLPAGTLQLESVFVPIWDAGSERVIRVISGQRDVTERRRIEGRLAHAQRLEAVGQLTGGVAHDFNNLLTVVIGNLALLRRRLEGDERACRYLASVETAAERGAKLTASLLAFSRRQTLQVAPIDVGAQLHESVTLLRRALGEEIEFTLEIAPGLPPAIADAAQLEAAVLNLAINARDAIGEAMAQRDRRGGALTIEVYGAVLGEAELEGNDEATPGQFIAISVQDSGVGMTAEVRGRAFEPFFTTKEIGQGTGLGLSQVFGFVRQLGGHITLESVPDQGTRAVVYLPVATGGDPQAAEDPNAPVPLPPGAAILVVEDDKGIREVTTEVLRDAGVAVLAAANGPAALEVLVSGARVDLLFSDVVMPGGATGIDLARAARALRPGLAVLLTSGYGGPALIRYGADGEFEVLAKPYTRAALLERIGRLLTPAA